MDQIFSAEFQRIHTDFISNIIHKALCGKANLRNTISSHRPCCRTVGIDGICFSSDIWTCILKSAGCQTIGCYGMSVGCISSLIGIGSHLFCKKMSFCIYACFHVIFNGVTGSGIGKGLLTCKLDFHRATAHLHGEKCIQRFIKHLLLVAETTAYIRLDHTYLPPGDSKCLTNNTAHNMGNLCGRNHHDPSLFHIGVRNIILNMAVLDNRCLIASFQLHGSLLHCAVHISDRKAGSCQNVILLVKMNGMLRSTHGNLRAHDHRIFLIFYFDQLQCPGSCHFVLSYYSCNIIAIIPYSSGEQITVCHILMSKLHGPGMSWGGITMIRYVLKGNYLYYAVQSLCFAGINGSYHAVSDLCMINPGYQTLIQDQVICKFRTSCHFLISVYSWNTLSNHMLHLLYIFCSGCLQSALYPLIKEWPTPFKKQVYGSSLN